MIHPGVRIVDVDPSGFAAVCAALAERDRRTKHEITVLHRAGVVRAVVDTAGLLGPGDVGPLDDPARTASDLRARTGADTVTIADETRLDDLNPALNALARSCPSQGELLWRARQLWQQHPAVAIAPEPAPARWATVGEVLAGVPDGDWVAVEARDDDGEVCFRLGGEVRDGLLTCLTSAPPTGPVRVVLRCPAPALDGILRSDDPHATLTGLIAEGVATIEGLPVPLV